MKKLLFILLVLTGTTATIKAQNRSADEAAIKQTLGVSAIAGLRATSAI